jgi:hypothetical protein
MPKKIRKKNEICPNCENTLENTWEFCPMCGQSVYEIQGTIKYMLNELSGNLYSFDSKYFHTVGRLFIRPGIVASEYVSGKMMRYVPPFRLYIFTSILFFLILSFRSCTAPEKEREASNVSLDTRYTYNDKEITPADYAKIKVYSRHQLDSFLVSSDIKPNFINRSILLKTAKISETGFNAFIGEIKTNATLGMFLLMPFSAFILYIFYRKKRRYYFDHLIATVYLHTAIFILFIISQLVDMVCGFEGFLYVLFLFYIYLIWTLHNFYSSRWKSAIWRSIPIVFIYFLFLIIFMLGVALTSIVTF